jgi:hypothetical protein
MPTSRAGTKRSRLRVSYINPLSVIKTTFIISLAFGLASIVALIMLWSVAKLSGTIDSATGLLTDIFGSGGAGFNIVSLLSLPRIIFIGSVFTVFQVVTWTLLSGIVSVIYNMFDEYVGGWEVTLTDDL